MEGSASFGYWVRRRRKALDLSQHDLARRTGYALTTIRKIETDARWPSREMAERLADILELHDDERAMFIQAARAELPIDRLPQPHAPPACVSSALSPPPLRTIDTWPNNLTTHPTAMLDRKQEVRAVCESLRDPAVRLLTLTGAPGVGKSRIGQQAAVELLESFTDGVFAINLTTVDTPTLLIEALGQALALRDQDQQAPVERLKHALQRRQLLLLLDNFERLVRVAPLIAELLAAAPGLKMLITSRVALRILGEYELPTAPFPLPEVGSPAQVATLATHPAIELFVTRTRAVRPNFALTPENAPTIGAICARLDGLPLAIELAAARAKLFSPQAILARLQHRLNLLTDGARDLPPHQQTMRSAISWSYDLLSAKQQSLFRQLGVFAGGCTLDAANAVCAGDRSWELEDSVPTPIPQPLSPVLDGLAALVDNSLLQHTAGADGEPRFVMLETIREFALEQLDAHAEIAQAHRQHALFYLRLAEAADEQASCSSPLAAIGRLREEHDNLRAALQWSLDQGETEITMRMSGALGSFWDINHRQ
jgi:predicted ATPase/transcriptional regulator with XRE-family HTH domain